MDIGAMIQAGVQFEQIVSQTMADIEAGKSAEALTRFNAAQTKRKAAGVRRVGAEGEFELRSQMRRQLARNRVSTAAAGVEAAGTPLESELLVIRDFSTDIGNLAAITQGTAQELELQAKSQLQQAADIRKATKALKESPGGKGKNISPFQQIHKKLF